MVVGVEDEVDEDVEEGVEEEDEVVTTTIVKLEEEVEEETEMTEAITLEANGVAKDLLKFMQGVALTDANEANELQAIFDAT